MTRINKVRAALSEIGAEAILITDSYNLRYLANFTGTTGIAVITQEEAVFVTDFRYVEQATKQAVGYTLLQNKREIFTEINDYLNDKGITKVAIEADQMNVSTYLRIQSFFGAEIIPTSGLVEKIRELKEETELETIRYACAITDEAYTHILNYVQPGMTEIQVANEVERFLKDKGASAMSFDTIVASGYRSAMPHGVATDKVIEVGDIVTLDFGCYYQGYSSDMTRTFAVGKIDPKLEEIYHIVREAQELVNANVKVGMTGKEVDAIARDYITAKGYGEYFGHGLGHGVGLNVHENPGVNYRNEEPLVAGMVITNEPGIYIEGLGGVRIEDDLILHEDYVEVVNKSPKHLITLPF